MNLKHEEKWKEGYDAYENGNQQEDCPYPAGSSDYASWVEGWIDSITDAGYTSCDDPQFL